MLGLGVALAVWAATAAVAPAQTPAQAPRVIDRNAPSAVTLTPAAPSDDGQSNVVETLEVIARPQGPALWVVTKGAAQVTVIGGYAPLPHSLDWNSVRVDRALQGADGFYEAKPSINPLELAAIFFNPGAFQLGGGRKLDQVIGPVRRKRLGRIAAIAHADTGRMQPYKPAVAGLFAYQTFLRAAGLSPEKPGTTIRRLAKTHTVPERTLAKIGAASMIRSIQRMDEAAQLACFDGALDQIEWESGHAVAAAKAWSEGRLSALRAESSHAILNRCLTEGGAPRAILEKAIADSTASLEDLLKKPGKSVALIDLTVLLPRNGVLDRLKAGGATINLPLDGAP
ncbi:TraB/GumN family protein [soil metagenome]